MENNKYDECGKKHGLWEYLYPNGKICSKGYYLNGKKIGRWFLYFRNGNEKVEQETIYVNHKRTLIFIFNRDSKIEKVKFYIK